MENQRDHVTDRVWQIAPIFMVVLMQAWRRYVSRGWAGVDWLYLGWMVAGWIIGWLIAELDHLFYTLMNNPQELTSQRVRAEFANKNWPGMWKLLNDTREERLKLPFRNVLTLFVIMVLGIWTATSGANAFGVGMTYGLGIRLLSEFLREKDREKWYWVFARRFSEKEHRIVVVGLVVLAAIQSTFLWR